MLVLMKRRCWGTWPPRWFNGSRPRSAALRSLCVALASLACSGLIAVAAARPNLPPAAPPPLPETPPPGPSNLPGELPRDEPRVPWRNLSPAQREAIRQLSREQREALLGRPGARPGGGYVPGAHLTPRERRDLRALIREEHERHGGGRAGSGRRP
jgi:hypothetical protein